jgi:hypothetical protein
MSKFNRGAVVATATAPIQTKARPTGRTYNGAPGFERDPKGELFLLAVANMVSEKTFYEGAEERDDRFRSLVSRVAVEDGDWFRRFVGWLRGPEANMRSASLVAAAEGVKARLDAGIAGNRQIVSSVLQRADEPGELLAYWISQFGRAVPKPVKRGISDAIQRLYNEYGTLKYDTQSATVRFADVLAITHAEPVAPWQADAFEFMKARRWNRDAEFTVPGSLGMLTARREADRLSRDELLARPDLLKAAGYTWENIAGKGAMDSAAWEAVIPNMGIMALVRNLRNFDQAGIGSEAQDFVRSRLTDPEVVKKSRMFPFRFLSAYQATGSENWGRELEVALNLSLANVPALPGRTLVLVDRSGSMFYDKVGGSLGTMTRADAAALFGTALALRSASADLVQFGSGFKPVSVKAGDSVLKAISKFGEMGGTNTQAAVVGSFKGHDRIVIITDEQATSYRQDAVGAGVPDTTPIYTWNLAAYKYGHNASGGVDRKARYTMGGLSDAAFKLIPLLERGNNADYPF